jgi:hypothetical protein
LFENRHTLKDIDAVIDGVVKIEQTLSRWDRQNREPGSGITPISSPASVVRPAPQAPGERTAFFVTFREPKGHHEDRPDRSTY